MTPARPLYVDSTAGGIRLEGPALVIGHPGQAETRVPLRRLARVVVRGAVPFATDALLGCLDAQVPVTFVALDGQVRGYCVGREQRDWSIGSLLERLTAEADWSEVLARWSRHAESAAIHRTCLRMQLLPDLDTRPATVWTLIARSLPGGSTPGAKAVMRGLEGLLRAHLAELLQRSRIPPCFRGQGESALDIRPCFVATLRWHLWPTTARFLEHGRRHPHQTARSGRTTGAVARASEPSDVRRRRLVIAYEATAPLIEGEFRRLLAGLDLLLREHLS